jgi:hypothetical protein
MAVKRIVANIATDQVGSDQACHGDMLGMRVAMDLGWILNFASEEGAARQISVAAEAATPPRRPMYRRFSGKGGIALSEKTCGLRGRHPFRPANSLTTGRRGGEQSLRSVGTNQGDPLPARTGAFPGEWLLPDLGPSLVPRVP